MPSADSLLDALDPEQRQVAEALRGPVRVLAGAGTGKTRAITHRIAYGVASGVYVPTEVLAVTFTTRAAGEMRGRLRRLGAAGVQARTFHSAALRQLRYFWPQTRGSDLPMLTESKLGMLASAARRLRVPVDQPTLRDLASEVEWAKVSNIGPDDYARLAPDRDRSVNGIEADTVARVFGDYETVKRDQGRMDMEDVLLLTAGMLAEDERVAAAVRRQYKWFVVDEYQDVSPLQSALLDLWLGGRDELCVVGDPAQTIYSFAGADAGFLARFPTRYPGTTSIELVRNYRSTPQIVTAANALLAAGTTRSVTLRAESGPGPDVRFTGHPDEVAEADETAERIVGLRADGIQAADVAVLVRINAQTEVFEEALSSRGIPYIVRGAARFFERPEVRQAVTLLRGSARARGSEQDLEGEDLVAEVRATLAGMGWSPEAPAGRGQARDRWESLQALVDQAVEFVQLAQGQVAESQVAEGQVAESTATLGGFVDDLDRRAAEQHAPVADGVTIATLHAAKGLEWDVVFLCGLHEGTMPIIHADTPAAVEEERRLLYVGMTRARRELCCSWAAARNPGGRGQRAPSRFLSGLLPAESLATATARSDRRRSRKAITCRECGRPVHTAAEKRRGRCEDCPASYDEELFERLRDWRLQRAKADDVPAFVVFTDATLQLLAELRPGSADDLLRVNGIGRAKLERYGEDVLEVLQEFLGNAH